MSILVFIPMYNCAAQIPRVIDQLRTPQVQAHIGGVLCIDNRSTDGTAEAAEKALATLDVPHRVLMRNDQNFGLGGSHKAAIQYAREHGYTYLVVLHGDDQGTIADLLPELDKRVHEDVDFLMGARFMRGSRLEGYSLLRTAANQAFNLIFSVISQRRLYDLGSGLNLVRIEAFRNEFHERFADDLTFNYYLILAVAVGEYRLKFFPLTWREDDQVSNARLGRMGAQLLQLLWRRVSNPAAFFTGEHREIPRDAYTSTILRRWE